MNTNVVEKAALMVRPKSMLIGSTPEALSDRLAQLAVVKKDLFPCEVTSVQEIDTQLVIIDDQLKNGGQPLQVLDPAPFTWRNINGMPKMLPFSLELPCARITHDEARCELPPSTLHFYDDVRSHFGNLANNSRDLSKWRWASLATIIFSAPFTLMLINFCYLHASAPVDVPLIGIGAVFYIYLLWICGEPDAALPSRFTDTKTYRIEAKFPGLIPQATRSRIATILLTKRFDDVFLLAEMPPNSLLVDRQKLQPRPPRRLDPLVIGWKKGAMPYGTFFLIEKFDTTVLEDYVVDEFAKHVS